MRRLMIFILKTFLVLVVALISYRYFVIYQNGEIDNVNHFEEIGKGTGDVIVVTKRTYKIVKESEELKDLKDGLKEALKKDSI